MDVGYGAFPIEVDLVFPGLDAPDTGDVTPTDIDFCAKLPIGAMNIQFRPVSWMCPITEIVSLLSDGPLNDVELPS